MKKGLIVVFILSFYDHMTKVEIDNVEGIIEKIVTKDGKVGGLKKYAGRSAIIIITKGKTK